MHVGKMPGIQEFTTCCDGDSIVETTHSPGFYDDSECNMDFLGTQYDKYTYKRLLYPQMRWMQCKCPGVYKKRNLFKNKHLTAIHSPPWWNLNKFNKISLGSLHLCTSDEQYQESTRLSTLEMKRAVGLYPCFIDDNNRNKRKLRSTTNFRDGRKLKELTTVYKRECDMTSLSTSDSGTLSSSSKTQREIVKQVPSVNVKCNTPKNPDNIVECYLVENMTSFKKDNTGYFEVVSPSDDFTPNKRTHKHNSRGKHKEHKKDKVKFTTTTVITPVSEGSKEIKSHKSKKDKQLTPIVEYNSDQPPPGISSMVSAKSYHSIIRKKETSYPSTPDDNECSTAQLNSESIDYETKKIDVKEPLHKEDIKRVCFLELDKFPTKINKDIETRHSTLKDQCQGTSTSFEYVNDVRMEDKSLSVHLTSSSEDGRLSPSITKILNELLLDPEHEKVIKNVLHSLARKAALRKSLSNTIFELKGKEKLGISKRKSSGSIQNVSSSDLDRLHFEKYKASVDVAIKLLEDRMTKKIYDAVRIKEHRRKRKEERETYYKDIIACSADKEYVKEKSRRALDQQKHEEQSSLLTLKDIAERPFPKEDIRTTLAYNFHVKPSNGSPFKKNQETYEQPINASTTTHPRRNAFSIPGQSDFYQAQSNTSHSTNIPREDTANNFKNMGEGSKSRDISIEQNVIDEEDKLLKKTVSTTQITNSSTRMSTNEFTPMLQNCEDLIENQLPPTNLTSANNSNQDITDSGKSYTRGFRDVQVYRPETKRRQEDRHPRDRYNRAPSSDFQPDGLLVSEPHYYTNERISRSSRREYNQDFYPSRDKSYSRDSSPLSEHPRNSRLKESSDYRSISPSRNYIQMNNDNNVTEYSNQDDYVNQSEERDRSSSSPDIPHSEKDTYFPQNDDTQGRLPRIQESKESNKVPNNPSMSSCRNTFYTGYPNNHRVSDFKMRYDRPFHSEYRDKPYNKNANEKPDALFDNNQQPGINHPSLNTSTDSTVITPISQHETHSFESKQPSTAPIPGIDNEDIGRLKIPNRRNSRNYKLVDEAKIKFSESNQQRRLPPYDDNYDESGDYGANLSPEYYYSWYMGSYPNCPRGRYDNLPYLNGIQPSAQSSQDSLHDSLPYNYDFSGPFYSERIRYTCRVQGTENANLISFVVFLMLFIGLFQYLNIHIN